MITQNKELTTRRASATDLPSRWRILCASLLLMAEAAFLGVFGILAGTNLMAFLTWPIALFFLGFAILKLKCAITLWASPTAGVPDAIRLQKTGLALSLVCLVIVGLIGMVSGFTKNIESWCWFLLFCSVVTFSGMALLKSGRSKT